MPRDESHLIGFPTIRVYMDTDGTLTLRQDQGQDGESYVYVSPVAVPALISIIEDVLRKSSESPG